MKQSLVSATSIVANEGLIKTKSNEKKIFYEYFISNYKLEPNPLGLAYPVLGVG